MDLVQVHIQVGQIQLIQPKMKQIQVNHLQIKQMSMMKFQFQVQTQVLHNHQLKASLDYCKLLNNMYDKLLFTLE
jgi:hypothetical protein